MNQHDQRVASKPKHVAEMFPTAHVLWSCFWRTWFVGAVFNTRGMQNVGLAYAMDPGLRAIYTDPEDLRNARKRYVRHYNTHPFWTPLLVGIFLGIEKKISHGTFPAEVLEKVRSTTIYTLSAIGDSFFGGSVLVTWSLTTVCLYMAGMTGLATAWVLSAWLALLVFKAVTFWYGFKEGLTVLQRLSRWDLINMGQRLKIVNGALLSALIVLAWPGQLVWHQWMIACLGLGGMAALLRTVGLSREILAALLVAGYFLYPSLLGLFAA